MNIIFLTISRLITVNERNIYSDLIRKFKENGHKVFIVSPRERKYKESTKVQVIDGVNILGVKSLNLVKSNFLEKGIGQILLEYQYKVAIKKYYGNIKFDLILYTTPPITFNSVIKYLKKKNPNALTYLMLKDIFPQNAVDLGLIQSNSFLYKFFKSKEKKLYIQSDFIGCMSPANKTYVIKNNPYINSKKVEICPNSIEYITKSPLSIKDKIDIRRKYNLPEDKIIFLYGGNIGKPQGVDYITKCLEYNKKRDDCFFLIVGSGSESYIIENWIIKQNKCNCKLIQYLPKNEYDEIVAVCDVGLIFLDYRFSIPNYPSRLLSYLENSKPIIAATDDVSDVGLIAELNEYGYRCRSNDVYSFSKCVDLFVRNPDSIMIKGNNALNFLKKNYTVDIAYETIMKHIK